MSQAYIEQLRQHVCLYASFDKTIDADFSRGDGRATLNEVVVRHDRKGGRYGGALVFEAKDHGWAEDEFFYAATDNFPYRSASFSGTVSLWLKGNPDADLAEAYPVDPFHISRHPADGSFYLDLTRPNGTMPIPTNMPAVTLSPKSNTPPTLAVMGTI